MAPASSRLVLWVLILVAVALYSYKAVSWEPVQLREAALTYKKFVSDGRDPLLYPEVHHEAIDVTLDMDILKYAYWDNTILSETTTGQYRSIGLRSFLVGVHVFPWLDIQYAHQSLHVLDREYGVMDKFPVEDSVGLKLYLYRNQDPKPTVIK